MKKSIIYSLLAIIVAATAIVGCLPKDHITFTGPTVIEFKNHTRGVLDVSLNKLGVYSCTAQTDSTRTVNTNSIAFKQKAVAALTPTKPNGVPLLVAVPATTVNVLSCVSPEDNISLTALTPTYILADPTLAANARGTDSVLVQLVGPQRSTPTVVNFSVRPSGTTAVEGTDFAFIPAGARTVTIPANSSSAWIVLSVTPKAVGAAISTTKLTLDLLGASDAAASPNYAKFIITFRKNL